MADNPAEDDPAGLAMIRAAVTDALGGFIAQRRADLASMSESLLPCADAITDLLASGKRLRAAFCYWGWRACGGEDCPPIFAAAAALELLHASALVHDDVIDASATRRGQPAVHKRFAASHAAADWRGAADAFGAGAAILIGDLLLAWTDEMLRASGLPARAVSEGMTVLDAMRTEVLAGQFLDLAGQAAGSWRLDDALRVIAYKSAKYTVERPLHLGVALACAARASGRPGQLADRAALTAAFTGFGIPLGTAFQLRDDILGIFGDPARTGKPVSDDLREGKRTVLLAIARQRADAEQALMLDQSVGDPQLTDARAAEIKAVIAATGAYARCEAMIAAKVGEALEALEAAPIDAVTKTALAFLAIATTYRAD
jgi:geranylgeranyl diphosphate synthase, type I